MALLSSGVSSGQGEVAAEVQQGPELACDVGRGKDDHPGTTTGCADPATGCPRAEGQAQQPRAPISHFLPGPPQKMDRLFPAKEATIK